MPRAILGALGGPNDPLAIPGRALRVEQRVDVAGRLAPQARRLPAALPGREIYLHADNKLNQQAIDRTANAALQALVADYVLCRGRHRRYYADPVDMPIRV
jgi:hypothetical protein